jgi:hypothetical protein
MSFRQSNDLLAFAILILFFYIIQYTIKPIGKIGFSSNSNAKAMTLIIADLVC